jgi:hypothetical protein
MERIHSQTSGNSERLVTVALTIDELAVLREALRLKPFFGGTRGWDYLPADHPDRIAWERLKKKVNEEAVKMLSAVCGTPDRSTLKVKVAAAGL